MPKAPTLSAAPANRLLASLPAKEYQRLLPELEPVTLAFAEVIYAPGDTIRHVYFPNNSIVSLLAAEDHHASLEIGMIGNESDDPAHLPDATNRIRASYPDPRNGG